MNTCGTCRYLGKEKDKWDTETYEARPSGFFECEAIKHNEASNWGGWKLLAGVVDGSGYYAALCVREDFGCAMWEAK